MRELLSAGIGKWELTVEREGLGFELEELRVLLQAAFRQVQEGVEESDGAARIGDLLSADCRTGGTQRR